MGTSRWNYFLWNKFVLKCYKRCYKRCAASVNNTGKQQFSANQGIYQLSDKDRSVPDDIDLWSSVFTRLYEKHLLFEDKV